MTAAPEVRVAARAHLAHGRAIVAVRADKKPWGDAGDGKNWRRLFTLEEIEARLTDPRCVAIGFLGGELNNGIVPLDFDTEAGEQWWREQCSWSGIDAEDFPTVITPGKIKPDGTRRPGRHRYVTDVRGILGNSVGKLKELGIDVRGRGHAMLPPSPHPDGGFYAWAPDHSLDDFPDGIPVCPDFVYQAIEAEQRPPHHVAVGNGQAKADDSAYCYCRAALDHERRRVADAGAGARNQTLNDAVLGLGHLAHYGAFTEDEVRSTMAAACAANGYIAEDGRGAFDATFASAWCDGTAVPRQVSEREPKRRRKPPTSAKALAGVDDENEGPQLKALCLLDFVKLDIPPRKLLLSPIMRQQDLVMVHAWRGIGKTQLIMSLGHAISTGSGLLGWTAPAPHPVLYVDGEMPARTMQDRMKGFMAGAGRAPDPDMFRIVTPDLQDSPIPDIASAKGQALIEAHLGRQELLILDNLSSLSRAGIENEGESWLPIQEWCLSLRRRGFSVLIVHHDGKGGLQRGTSRREDILDLVIGLRRPSDYLTTDGARFEIHFDKSRGLKGEETLPIEARMHTGTDDSAIWTWRAIEDAVEERIVELSDSGLKQRDIARELNVSLGKVNKIVKRARKVEV